MNEHFDALETRDPSVREQAQMAALARQVAYAKANAPAFARTLRDVDAEAVRSREALVRLPVIRKSALAELQRAERPFGGLAAMTLLGFPFWLSVPAAIIGMPVGFVGAAESKETLAVHNSVPFLIVKGRKGGSAMAVAAVNALASEAET